jgi:hypothetical protein
MFKKIKEFFSKKSEVTTDATWPFPTARAIDIPIITPEPINAVPVPTPPVVEPEVKKAPAVKTTAKTTKAAPKPPAPTKTNTTTKRSPGRPSKNQ